MSMLLSRVAESLYWISRYLERAEHTARVVHVAVELGLGGVLASGDGAIHRLYTRLGMPGGDVTEHAVAEAAFFDLADPNAVFSCIVTARENARQVREEISADMWGQLNGL